MLNLLLAAENGAAGAAVRQTIVALTDVDLAWDACETADALRLVEVMHPDVALFSHSLMDIQLLTSIRAAADTSSHTKILVISMHNDSRFALRAIEAGASGYMLQDRAFEELENAVKTIMAGRTYISPGIAGVERPVAGMHGPLDVPSPVNVCTKPCPPHAALRQVLGETREGGNSK